MHLLRIKEEQKKSQKGQFSKHSRRKGTKVGKAKTVGTSPMFTGHSIYLT